MFSFPQGTPSGFNPNSDILNHPNRPQQPAPIPQQGGLVWRGPMGTTPQAPGQTPGPAPAPPPAPVPGQAPPPSPGPLGGTLPGGMAPPPGTMFSSSPLLAALTDATPYNKAVDRGNQFIRTTPTSASPLTSFSPNFGNLSKNMQSALNSQWNARGSGLQNQAGLEFSRKAGTEVPRFMLSQQLGLRGLENDWSDLQNDFLRNDTARTTGGLNALLQLLGAFGSFF